MSRLTPSLCKVGSCLGTNDGVEGGEGMASLDTVYFRTSLPLKKNAINSSTVLCIVPRITSF